MNLLEYFDEEYSKVQKSHGSITAAILQANDIAKSLTIAYKKLSDIKPDLHSISEIESDKLEELLSSMNNFIRDCKNFADDIDIAIKATEDIRSI